MRASNPISTFFLIYTIGRQFLYSLLEFKVQLYDITGITALPHHLYKKKKICVAYSSF